MQFLCIAAVAIAQCGCLGWARCDHWRLSNWTRYRLDVLESLSVDRNSLSPPVEPGEKESFDPMAPFVPPAPATKRDRVNGPSLSDSEESDASVVPAAWSAEHEDSPPLPPSEAIPARLEAGIPSGDRDEQSRLADDAAIFDTAPADAAEVPFEISLALDEARAAALAGNLDLQVQLIDPAIAREVVNEEIGRFEAVFSAALSHRRIDSPPLNAQFGAPTEVDRIDPAIIFPLATGGTLTVESSNARTEFLNSGLSSIYDTSAGASFTQPLLRGSGLEVNTAGIAVARYGKAIADSRTKLTAINVLADVERAYWRLFAARGELEIAQQQIDIGYRQAEVVERLIEAELVPEKVERLRAQAGLQARRIPAISAEVAVRLRERDLKRIMQRADLPVGYATHVVPTTAPNPLGLHLDRRQLEAQALEHRMEMVELELQLLVNDVSIAVQDNSVRPRLDFTARQSWLGSGANLGRSFDRLFDAEFDDFLVGVTGELPLAGNVSARARLQQALFERLRTVATRERLSQLILQEINDAVDRLERDWLRILAANRSVDLAQQTYDAELQLNQRGQRTTDLVLLAAERLATAQIERVRALADYQISKVDLAVATGTMLGYGQIFWSPMSARYEWDMTRREDVRFPQAGP